MPPDFGWNLTFSAITASGDRADVLSQSHYKCRDVGIDEGHIQGSGSVSPCGHRLPCPMPCISKCFKPRNYKESFHFRTRDQTRQHLELSDPRPFFLLCDGGSTSIMLCFQDGLGDGRAGRRAACRSRCPQGLCSRASLPVS